MPDKPFHKNPLSMQLDPSDFLPASDEDKKELIVMRESVTFWKDAGRRLRKNKVAMGSLIVIVLTILLSVCI